MHLFKVQKLTLQIVMCAHASPASRPHMVDTMGLSRN